MKRVAPDPPKNVYSHRLLLWGGGSAAAMALRAACSGITNKRLHTPQCHRRDTAASNKTRLSCETIEANLPFSVSILFQFPHATRKLQHALLKCTISAVLVVMALSA